MGRYPGSWEFHEQAKNVKKGKIFYFIDGSLHQVSDDLFWVSTNVINFFLDDASLVTVDVTCGHVDKVFDILALFGQLHHFQRTVDVDANGFIKSGVKIDGSSTVDDDMQIFNEFLTNFLLNSESRFKLFLLDRRCR